MGPWGGEPGTVGTEAAACPETGLCVRFRQPRSATSLQIVGWELWVDDVLVFARTEQLAGSPRIAYASATATGEHELRIRVLARGIGALAGFDFEAKSVYFASVAAGARSEVTATLRERFHHPDGPVDRMPPILPELRWKP